MIKELFHFLYILPKVVTTIHTASKSSLNIYAEDSTMHYLVWKYAIPLKVFLDLLHYFSMKGINTGFPAFCI